MVRARTPAALSRQSQTTAPAPSPARPAASSARSAATPKLDFRAPSNPRFQQALARVGMVADQALTGARPAPAARLGLPNHGAGGAPIAPPLREKLEQSFHVDLSRVRVHTDASSQAAAKQLSARAFTHGQHIHLGPGESADDLRLLAHEVAHVVQQAGAAAVQRFTSHGGDAHEREAERASAAASRGESFTIRERTSGTRVQRLGISDALNFFADRANAIPGYRMFTIVLGVNPINMSPVERSAANILRALVELLPGGNLITQALDNYGVFARVGGWVEQQIRSLGMTGSMIRDALNRFLDSLGWRDIFDLGGVWSRAVRIFSEPIDRILSFGRGLVTGIVDFIKDAILRPLAGLASQTRGWDLLKAVLGRDPITGDPVPRNAETLIGGFMRLIGQEEIWQNIQRGNAIGRAWTWFQTALGELMGFVQQIPGLFLSALRSLQIADIVLLPRAFAKVATAFGNFIGQFLSWAGNTIWNLLEIVFSVVAPGVVTYMQRARAAFRTILRNPIGFVGNLVRAGMQGLRQFARNFLTHLRASLIGWLTGAMSGASIYIPQGFNLREILKFVLSVLGLTWQNIRQKLVRAIGETAVRAMETTFDIVVTLVTQGPAAAWEKIQESLTNLREMVMEQIMTFVRDRVVQAAITRLLSMLSPAGAFIQAIIAIYNTIMFFVERMRQIAQVAASVIDALSAIANGVIGAAANRVEQTMAGLLTLVISFLARIAGLGRVSDAVTNVVNRVRQPIDRALDRVVEWIVAQARRLGRFVAQAGVPQDPNERLRLAGQAAVGVARRLTGRVTRTLLDPALAAIRTRFGLTLIQPFERRGTWWVRARINPENETNLGASSGPSGPSAVSPEAQGDRATRVKARVREHLRGRGLFANAAQADGVLGSVFARFRADGLQYIKISRAPGELSIRIAASAEEEATKATLGATLRVDDLDLTAPSTALTAVVNGQRFGRVESIPHGLHAEELLISRLAGDASWRRDPGGRLPAGDPRRNVIEIDITRSPCGRERFAHDCGSKLLGFATRTNSRLVLRIASFYAGSRGRHAQGSRGSLDRLAQSKNVTLQPLDVLNELGRLGINPDEISAEVRQRLAERATVLREEFERLERIFKR